MNENEFAQKVLAIKEKFITEIFPKARNQYEIRAFSSIVRYLSEMEDDCRGGNLKAKTDRYGYVARLVAESDPDLLSPEFGGQLIDIEKIYRNL